MGQVNRFAVMPFEPAQMFALVNDIGSYPEFLIWCNTAEVEDVADNQLTATLGLSLGVLRQTVTTRNTMLPNERIDMELVRGPFRQFNGVWRFDDMGAGKCRVDLNLAFEFNSKLLQIALDKVFEHLTYMSVDAFKNRAKQLYGQG